MNAKRKEKDTKEEERLKKIRLDYFKRIDWTIQYKDGDSLKEKCPLCGKNVMFSTFGTYEQSYVIHCETGDCLQITSRGL